MIRETFPVGILRCNCSIVGDERTREAVVVDPGADVAEILARVARHGLTVKRIVVTHAHIDHIAGAKALKAVTGAPVEYSQKDPPLVAMMDVQAGWLGVKTPEVDGPDVDLADGAAVGVVGLAAQAILTPGHTPGSACVWVPAEGLLLAGDTLFAGSVGRTDLPGGDMRALLDSIRCRLLELPETTVVVPGHGPETTIGEERDNNPFLK